MSFSKTAFLVLLAFNVAGCSEKILSSIKRADSSELIYLLEPAKFDGRPSLLIDLLFRGEASGETLVRLPSVWAGQSKLERSVKGLVPLTAGAQIRGTDQPSVKRILHKPSEVLHLRYWLVQDFDSPIQEEENFLRPIVQDTYFHWLGGAGLVQPDWPMDRKLDVSLRWLSFPPGAAVINSYGSDEWLQGFEATLPELQNSLFLGGDVRVQEFSEGKSRMKIAVRGQPNFEDTQLAAFVKKIWKTQLGVLGDETVPFRFLSLLSVGKQCCTYHSARARHTLVTVIASDQGIGLDMKRVISGELLRSRLDDELGALAREPRWFWLRTGFAQFASRLMGFQSGEEKGWTLENYLDDFNASLREQAFSPAKDESYRELTSRAGTDRLAGRELYLRGDILGQAWYASVRRDGKSLETLEAGVPELLRQLRAHPDEAEVASTGLSKAKPMAPMADWMGPCAKLQKVSLRAFELGFDLESSKQEGRISGVKHDSAAFRAGLRRDQRLLSWRVRLGDPAFEAEIRVREGKSEKTIRFLPVSLTSRKISQFIMDAGAATTSADRSDACLRGLGLH